MATNIPRTRRSGIIPVQSEGIVPVQNSAVTEIVKRTRSLTPETMKRLGMVPGFKPHNPKLEIDSPYFNGAVANVANFAMGLPDRVVNEGRSWHDIVRDTAARQSRDVGISRTQGIGIVAAVSPGMDFEAHNINAINEIMSLNDSHWNMIRASATQPRREYIKPSGQRGTAAMTRHPEVISMLREVAPSLSRANDSALMDAWNILHGGMHPDEAMPAATSAKRNRFFHNIDDPDEEMGATIDGRQGDIIHDMYRGWTYTRNLAKAGQIPGGTRTNYEKHEEVLRRAASVVSAMDPRMRGINANRIQATTWVGGKLHELSWPTKDGSPRRKGVERSGQRYSDDPVPGWRD